jgi:hypothetical protein
MEPHLAPPDFRAARTATSGHSNCRQQANLIVVDQLSSENAIRWKAMLKFLGLQFSRMGESIDVLQQHLS